MLGLGLSLPQAALRRPSGPTFIDSFNRADQTLETNANWTLASGPAGSASIISNAVGGTGTEGYYLAPTAGSPNQWAEAAIYNNPNLTKIILWWTDADNYIAVDRWNSTEFAAWQMKAGTYSTIGTFPCAFTSGHRIRAEISENTLTLKYGAAGALATIGTQALTEAQPAPSNRLGLTVTGAAQAGAMDNWVSSSSVTVVA